MAYTTYAERLANHARGYVAWNVPTSFHGEYRVGRNQYGTTYRFRDGSRAFVPKGTADVIVRR